MAPARAYSETRVETACERLARAGFTPFTGQEVAVEKFLMVSYLIPTYVVGINRKGSLGLFWGQSRVSRERQTTRQKSAERVRREQKSMIDGDQTEKKRRTRHVMRPEQEPEVRSRTKR